ncbi:hypothetical protein C7212DRAFT_210747, partial [Tuber magnatum]
QVQLTITHICSVVTGVDYPNCLVYINNLASMPQDEEKYNESETLYQSVLKRSKGILGIGYPNSLTTISNLSSMLQA